MIFLRLVTVCSLFCVCLSLSAIHFGPTPHHGRQEALEEEPQVETEELEKIDEYLRDY